VHRTRLPPKWRTQGHCCGEDSSGATRASRDVANLGAFMTWAFLDLAAPNGFAHRGGDEHAPENTVAAFQHAVDLGYRYLETDVHRTRDGVLVAFHDGDLNRLAGRPGAIADHAWPELREIDLGGGATIPTLDELLLSFPDVRFNIDPKADDAVPLLASTLQAHRAVDRVCVGSFSDRRVAEVLRILGPSLCTAPGPRALVRTLALGKRGGGDRHGAVQIPPSCRGFKLTARFVERLHDMDLQVHVWTINTEGEMHQLLDLGVDAVMTDRVQLLKDVMTKRGEWP
jgi:glycerophosphoryl diester phosphodiesterase